VTQDNQGKKTAGIDGIQSLTPPQRLTLAKTLKLTETAQPTRRVCIPAEKRGLGIPVMRVRAAQALVKLALEPQWEAHFEPNSYGFRKGTIQARRDRSHLHNDETKVKVRIRCR
jgi:RNA-directed DNA polymerase